MNVDFAFLILRVLIGLVVAAHGAQKLFGWAGGPGLQGFGGWMHQMGLKPGLFWATLGALGEFGGGVLLAAGLLTPLAAVGVVGAMAMAVALVHWAKGFWITSGGYEYPLVLLGTSAVIGIAGPGAYSLDSLFGIILPSWVFWVGLVGAALMVGYGLMLAARKPALVSHPTAH